MTNRPRLFSIELTGPRAAIRRIAQFTLVGAAALGAVGYMLPAHRLVYWPGNGGFLDAPQAGDAHFHSLLDDSSPTSVLVLLLAATLIGLLTRTRKLGTGMLSGVLGAGAAILALLPIILVHLFSHYESSYGDAMFAIGELALLFVGAAVVVVEPVLFLLERRRIERATRPAPLPVARIASLA